jgi:hypothetical protein
MLRQIKHPIHVGKLNSVIIVENEMAYAASRQHFSDDGANTADSDDNAGKRPDLLVIGDNTHFLERHQSRVRICIFNLCCHSAAIIHFTI